MRRVNVKKAAKIASRVWIATGAMVVAYGLVLAYGAPVAPTSLPTSDALSARRIEAARTLWAQESDAGGDAFSAGFAAFEMASVLRDPKWSAMAIDRLGDAQAALPQMAQIGAWRGAAHALMARDFPMQGLWQLVPGPGFVRIYHVRSAVSALNDAVSADPADPVSRLLRAASLSGMPGLLVSHDTMRADFALMATWADDASLNPAHADVLQSAKWREDFFRLSAQAYEKDGQSLRAQAQWRRLAAEAQTPDIKELSEWNAARLTQ